jgi:hypothetical protein
MNGLFVTPQEELAEISYNLLLRRKSEVELYKERQKKIQQEIFNE